MEAVSDTLHSMDLSDTLHSMDLSGTSLNIGRLVKEGRN